MKTNITFLQQTGTGFDCRSCYTQ